MTLIEEALDELAQVTSFDGLDEFARQICTFYRVQNVAFQIVSPSPHNGEAPLFIATYERQWIQRYIERDYFKIDPVVLAGANGFLPFDWDELDRSSCRTRSLFDEAESYGVGRRGLTVPVRGPGRERSLITVTTVDTKDQWAQRRCAIQRDFHVLAHFLHERSLRLSGLRPTFARPSLSSREKQCLELLARGHAPKQIAYELDLAIGTVRLYLSSARSKLGAANKYEAIARAVQNELVFV